MLVLLANAKVSVPLSDGISASILLELKRCGGRNMAVSLEMEDIKRLLLLIREAGPNISLCLGSIVTLKSFRDLTTFRLAFQS